jgi:dienelactone hydrolase
VGDQAQLGELTSINDAYRALELLAKHPRIDPARIGIFGGSRGGVVALYSSLARFQRMHMAPGTQFAVYISFYPPCVTTYVEDIDVAARPIRLFHGTADDIAPVEQCRAYVERLRRAGADVELTEYVGARHGFDNPSGAAVTRVREGSPGLAPCSRYENPVGRIINRNNDLPRSRDDECLRRPATVGYDADATGVHPSRSGT